jgi:hypothetical protein
MFDALDPSIEWRRAAIIECRDKSLSEYESRFELRCFVYRCLNYLGDAEGFLDRCREKADRHRAAEDLIARNRGCVRRCSDLSLIAVRIRLLQRAMLRRVLDRHGRLTVRDAHGSAGVQTDERDDEQCKKSGFSSVCEHHKNYDRALEITEVTLVTKS